MDGSLRKQLALTIRALYFLLDEALNKCEPSELTSSGRHLLWVLSTQAEPISMKEISEFGRWHKSTVTRLIPSLVDKGYIKIESMHHRQKKVSLTKKGIKAIQQFVPTLRFDQNFPFDLTGLTEEDIERVIKVGQMILKNHQHRKQMEWIQSSKVKIPME